MYEKRKAPHRCNDDGAMSQNRLLFDRSSSSLTQDFEKGGFAVGLLTAVSVGGCLIHWALF